VGWIFGPIIGSLFFYSKDTAGHSTGSQTLYIPYVGVAVVVLVLAVTFFFANVPDVKAEDDYRLDQSDSKVSHSIWSHPHFVLAVAAQFFYVAAQAGIFSFFINYMTSEVPPIPAGWNPSWSQGWFETRNGALSISDQGAAALASAGFFCFLIGRFTGAILLKKFSAHKVLGLYGLLNVVACLLVFLKLGWVSVACVFLSYFFMSIMFPTIFALGIFGLGNRAKRASAYIVMAIMGGAILPKVMGYVADKFDMSRGFIVPLVCFAFVAFYGFNWSRFSKAEGLYATREESEGRSVRVH
jgi:FHS family L-fucose permease-like MFS transporter